MRPFVIVGTTLLVAWGLQAVWGLSWGWSDFPDCAQGSEFFADAGWAVQGLGLAMLLGAIGGGVLAAIAPFEPALALGVFMALGLGLVGEACAVAAEEAAGCWPMNDDIGGLLAILAVLGVAIGLPIGSFIRRSGQR